MTFQNFIVLGLIPGTKIQITFQLWIQFVGALSGLYLTWVAWQYRQELNDYLLDSYAQWQLREWEFYGLTIQ